MRLSLIALFILCLALPAQAQVGWIAGQGDAIPRQAQPAGREANGQALFACVAPYNNGMHPGKTRPGFGGCNIPYGGREIAIWDYHMPRGGFWRPAAGGEIPGGAFAGGFEANGQVLYFCRAEWQGGVHPGKIRAGFRGCNIPYGGQEITVGRYEVLTEW